MCNHSCIIDLSMAFFPVKLDQFVSNHHQVVCVVDQTCRKLVINSFSAVSTPFVVAAALNDAVAVAVVAAAVFTLVAARVRWHA